MKESDPFGLYPEPSSDIMHELKVSGRQRVLSWFVRVLLPITNKEVHMKRFSDRFHIGKLTAPLIPEQLNLIETGAELTSVNIPDTTIPLVQHGGEGVYLEFSLLELDKLDGQKIKLSAN